MNRSAFISKQASEKLTLVHVHGRKRAVGFDVYSGNTYSKQLSRHAVNVYNGTTELTQVSDKDSVGTNQWAFDYLTNILYININDDPADNEIIVDYRFFFSDRGVIAPYNIPSNGHHVNYEGRVKTSPGYSFKVGYDQNLTSIVGSGNLVLENTDGGLDDIYDTYFFDERIVEVFSWNPDIPFTEARIIFRARIINKGCDDSTVIFKIKDAIFDLKRTIPQTVYSDADNVTDSVKGKYKRWAYGRVDGIKCQSIDQIGSGYLLTGTLSAGADTPTITGSGTSFLSECSPGDKVIVETQEFNIATVDSNTQLTMRSNTRYSFTGKSATIIPEIPVITKNRQFLVTGHACAVLTKTVVKVIQFNRIQLNNTIGLFSGDFVQFESAERIEIKTIAPNNIIVLRQNIIDRPSIGSDVIRQPIQTAFIKSTKINSEDFTLTNTSNGLKLIIDSDAEYNLARPILAGFSATFTNGSRDITTTDDIDLREILSIRDWIKPDSLTYTQYYEILNIDQQTITIREPFAQSTITEDVIAKRPDYINDDTIISANILGKTSSGNADDTWLSDGPEIIRDILSSINIPVGYINETSFTSASNISTHDMSLMIPSAEDGNQTTANDVIDKINNSIKTSLTLDNDLKVKIKVMLPSVETDIIELNDYDVISWSAQGTSNDIINSIVANYRHKDIDRFTQEAGSNTVTFESDFVNKYIGTTASDEVDLYLYDSDSAQILAERTVYYRSLGRTDFTIKTDLRLENIEVGDQVILNFNRLYKRFGDSESRKKIVMVVGKSHDGFNTTLNCTDISNIYNTSAFITDNSINEYAVESENNKLKCGFITDSQGIIVTDDTANINRIV